MTMAAFRGSFYYGGHADMQFKYLAELDDEQAAEAIAEVLAMVGEVVDTGDLDALRSQLVALQVAVEHPTRAAHRPRCGPHRN